MREILCEMVHNSIWGTISLIAGGFTLLYCALFMGLRYIWNHYHKKYELSKLKRILAKNGAIRKVHFIIPMTAFVICVVTFVLFLFKDRRVEHQDYNYIQTEMAEQKSLDILFLNEIQIELNDNKDIRRLHISIGSPMTEITEKEIEKRTAIFAAIYQVEIKMPDQDIKLDSEAEEDILETGLKISGMKPEEFMKYQKEYEEWSTLFTNRGWSSDLYQMSRAARDMLEVGHSECNDEELLKIAAEAVYRSESFLEYGNWNINTKKNPVIIEPKDILFYNGKVFYQLYLEAGLRDELKEYRNDFIVNAYVCMFLAGEEFAENDTAYAKVNYYIGNIREKMLSEIPMEDLFYKEIIKDALEHYEIALSSLKNRPDYYDKEDNMEKNCHDGISTLNNN